MTSLKTDDNIKNVKKFVVYTKTKRHKDKNEISSNAVENTL